MLSCLVDAWRSCWKLFVVSTRYYRDLSNWHLWEILRFSFPSICLGSWHWRCVAAQARKCSSAAFASKNGGTLTCCAGWSSSSKPEVSFQRRHGNYRTTWYQHVPFTPEISVAVLIHICCCSSQFPEGRLSPGSWCHCSAEVGADHEPRAGDPYRPMVTVDFAEHDEMMYIYIYDHIYVIWLDWIDEL